MIRTPRTVTTGVAVVLAATALAACGSSTHTVTTTAQAPAASPVRSSVAPTPATSPAAPASASTVVIGSFKTPQDGTLITGAAHRSLYMLMADEKTTASHDKSSTCYGACATVWPPVLASKIPAVSGLAKRTLVGLSTRKDGTKQVTYNGLPLYYYVADKKAGQSVGNHLKDGFGLWIGVLPSGKLAPDGAN